MSEPLMIQAEVGTNSICLKPNVYIQINDINGGTNIEEALALNITDKRDYVLITGVLSFYIVAGVSGVNISDYLNIKIQLYRDYERINMAYYCEEQDAGINIVASGYKTLQIPIQLIERISIPVTEEYAKYYISIVATSNRNDYGTVLLEQFCIAGRELAFEETLYCEGI